MHTSPHSTCHFVSNLYPNKIFRHYKGNIPEREEKNDLRQRNNSRRNVYRERRLMGAIMVEDNKGKEKTGFDA